MVLNEKDLWFKMNSTSEEPIKCLFEMERRTNVQIET
jgi:hypothetical protein